MVGTLCSWEVTAGLGESHGSQLPRVFDLSHLRTDCLQIGISFVLSVVEPLPIIHILIVPVSLLGIFLPAPRQRLCDQVGLYINHSIILSVCMTTAKVIGRFH